MCVCLAGSEQYLCINNNIPCQVDIFFGFHCLGCFLLLLFAPRRFCCLRRFLLSASLSPIWIRSYIVFFSVVLRLNYTETETCKIVGTNHRVVDFVSAAILNWYVLRGIAWIRVLCIHQYGRIVLYAVASTNLLYQRVYGRFSFGIFKQWSACYFSVVDNSSRLAHSARLVICVSDACHLNANACCLEIDGERNGDTGNECI